MNIPKILIALVCALLMQPSLLPSQEKGKEKPRARVMKFNAESSLMIDEIGIVVSEEDGKPTVVFIAPEDRRPADAAGMDIKEGDEVGMANGKKVMTVGELKKEYEMAKINDEFKLGLRRDGRAYILTFKRKEAAAHPGRRMVIRRDGGGDESSDILPALGIAIEQKKESVVITEILPEGPKELQEGDVIMTLNGKEIKSVVDFSHVYDRTEEGDELIFSLERDGKKVTYTTKRTMPKGMMRVKVKGDHEDDDH